MPKVEFSIADSSPCISCGTDLFLEQSRCPSCGSESNIRTAFADIYDLLMQGSLIDARPGGLILGREHDEDDIPMLAPQAVGIFQLVGYMQGGEYILNRDAAIEHKEKILEINSYKDKDYTPLRSIRLTDTTRILNTNASSGSTALLVEHGQFVVNRAATARYYYELEELNNSNRSA
ncbi:MAG: hypothetical protein KME10_19105 [Plectolyngbya sp. WJT66-NPBG17]|jgi:hypothetical protein|nr:hypothetical protein [Plectolyngbya sp. WJT66-NPBG17]